MKTRFFMIIGIVLIIFGIIVISFGFYQYATVLCHCPAQIPDQPYSCECVEKQKTTNFTLWSIGSVTLASGILAIIWEKKK